MNYNFWFLLEQFRSLSVGGKIAVVAGHIVGLLLIILLETYRTQRHEAKRLSKPTSCSIVEPAEEPIHARTASQKKGNFGNKGKGMTYFLEGLRNGWRKYQLHYQAENPRDSPMYPTQRHIRAIVNKLRRRVNHSGKEPAGCVNVLRFCHP